MPVEDHAADLVGVEEAIRFAVSVREAERQGKFNGKCYTRRENKAYSKSELSRYAAGTREAKHETCRRKHIPQRANRLSTRNAHRKTALRYCKCQGRWYFARESSTREQGDSQQRGRKRNSPGKGNRSERSRMK
jgi:hypothetical protein